MILNIDPDTDARIALGIQRWSSRQAQWPRRYLGVLIFALAMLFLYSCKGSYVDYDQVDIFTSYFEEGMSRADVERKLAELGDFDIVDESEYENGDLEIEYRTSSYKQWGANVYAFRFTPDGKLTVVFPVVP